MSEKQIVAIISSALAPDKSEKTLIFDYFLLIIAKLSILLANKGFDVVLKIPRSQRFAGQDQERFIKEIRENANATKYYSGLIIVPYNKERISDELGKLIEKHSKLPILTIDKGFKDKREISSAQVYLPPFVMCDEVQGGKRAAQSLIYFFRENKEKIPRFYVAIIEGLEGSTPRIKGFVDEFESHFNDQDMYMIYKPLKAIFRREIAKDKAKSLIRDHDQTYHLNAFFCCNDEMALGVREALEEEEDRTIQEIAGLNSSRGKKHKEVRDQIMDRKKTKLQWIRSLRIVGFDGILEARLLIKQKDRWLLNS